MQDNVANRRSLLSVLRVEEEFTNRQVYRVACSAAIYLTCATFLLCVFYTYILNPTLNPGELGKPSLLSFPQDFRNQWHASADMRAALQIWFAGTLGMTAMFAIATGLVLSRKLAGPIYRLKTDMNKMKDGQDVFEIILRDGDELSDMTRILNETLATIENRHVERCGGGHSADLANDERMADLHAMRTHLDTLTTGPDHPEALTQWAARMRDLIDKAEPSSPS